MADKELPPQRMLIFQLPLCEISAYHGWSVVTIQMSSNSKRGKGDTYRTGGLCAFHWKIYTSSKVWSVSCQHRTIKIANVPGVSSPWPRTLQLKPPYAAATSVEWPRWLQLMTRPGLPIISSRSPCLISKAFCASGFVRVISPEASSALVFHQLI